LLVKIKRDLENQIRGLLKNVGLGREVLKLARPDLGGRWPSGLVATAAENCLNAPAQSAHAVWGSDADQIHGPNADPY
jgi:hypothetical protein